MNIQELPVVFSSAGVPLVGRFVLASSSLTEKRPTVIVTGAWLTVKEQMPLLYARRLAEAGYHAFVFDFSGFGQSGGTDRQHESPTRKMADIRAAADFVKTMSFVDADRIAQLAICGSAQYTLRVLADAPHVRAFVSVAGWYHDAGSIGGFYGGEPGIAMRLDRARVALDRFARTGETTRVPAYENGNDRAGMFFDLPYYAQVDRGAVPSWLNEMAEHTWIDWFTFDGLSAASRVATPTLMIHADACVLPENARAVHAALRGPKELVWTTGFQTDFYDLPDRVDFAMKTTLPWLARTLA